ncbi:MAG: hypothetical protein KBD83_03175 [Gammaproteobacteria bacterium]|nr:hypothetical protein [Gammaproteobacteria bacterium]
MPNYDKAQQSLNCDEAQQSLLHVECEQGKGDSEVQEEPICITAWMKLRCAGETLVYGCLAPFWAIYAFSAVLFMLLSCSALRLPFNWPDTSAPKYILQSFGGAIIAGLIVIAILETSCIVGVQLKNDSQLTLDFYGIQGGSFSPHQIGPGESSEITLHDWVTGTAELPYDPWYISITVDKEGMHAKYDGGGSIGLDGSKPKIDWGTCKYSIVDQSNQPEPAKCQSIEVINLTDLTCKQTGDLQPAGATASSRTISANGGSVRYDDFEPQDWVTVDYYEPSYVCGTWTFEGAGKSAKVENSGNVLKANPDKPCSFFYQAPATNLRGTSPPQLS